MTRRLQVFQSLWAMQPHDQTGEMLPLDRVCGMVRDAGFDGLAIDLGAADIETAHAVRPHLQRERLTPLIVAFPKSVEDFINAHDEVFVVEQNRDAQLLNLLLVETDVPREKLVPLLHYSGEPLDYRFVYKALKDATEVRKTA